jgi:hypothetical protein
MFYLGNMITQNEGECELINMDSLNTENIKILWDRIEQKVRNKEVLEQ